MLIAVWVLLLCPSLNGLSLPERCVLLHTIPHTYFVEPLAIQDGYTMPDFDFRVDGGSCCAAPLYRAWPKLMWVPSHKHQLRYPQSRLLQS